MKTRSRDIDAVAGLMVLTMVYCHIQVEYDGLGVYRYWNVLFHFFMPWFFFKAGMFHKIQEGFFVTAKKSSKRLLVPFLFFSAIGYLIVGLLYYLQHNLHVNFIWSPITYLWKGGFILGNEPLWFLLSLFGVKTIYSLFLKNISIECISTIGIVLAYVLYCFKLDLPLWCGNISLGLFFYGVGYRLRYLQFSWIFGTISLFLFATIAIINPSRIALVWNTSTGNYFLANLASICGCISINFLFRNLKIEWKWLSFIGENSIILLVTHMIIINIATIECILFNLGKELSFFIKLGLFVTMEPFLIRFFNKPNIKKVIGL